MPVCFAHLYVVVFRGLFYVGKCEIAVSIAYVIHLIKSCERAANMRRIGYGFLPHPREAKSRARQRADLRSV